MKFDDVDYHEAAALEAGRPIEQAFTHMGLLLGWMIRHDLQEPSMFEPEQLDAVRSGSWTGSDLRDDVDGKLVSDMFTAEGVAFLAARYDAYLDAYGQAFASASDYGVADDADARAIADQILDRSFAEWIAAGRPVPDPRAEPAFEFPELAAVPDIPLDQIPPGHIVDVNALTGTWETVDLREHAPHVDVDMEARLQEILPADAEVSSSTGTGWGDSRLSRVLRDLGVRPSDVTVTSAIGGTGPRVVTAIVYRIPGVRRERLHAAFAMVIHRPTPKPWETRKVEGTSVGWADGSFGPSDEPSAVAYWAEDGVVFHLYGPVPVVEAAIRTLS